MERRTLMDPKDIRNMRGEQRNRPALPSVTPEPWYRSVFVERRLRDMVRVPTEDSTGGT